MPVGVVAFDAVAQPDDVALAVVVLQILFDLGSCDSAGLRFLFSRHDVVVMHRAGAVEVHRAAFHDDAGIEHRQPQLLGDPRRHGVVGVVRRILAAPRVVAPVDDRRFGPAAARAQHERRTVIAGPAFVGGDVMKAHAPRRHACRREPRAHDLFVVDVRDVEVHRLERGDRADDLDDVVDAFLVAAGKRDAFGPRPANPGAGVPCPFGGKREAVFVPGVPLRAPGLDPGQCVQVTAALAERASGPSR